MAVSKYTLPPPVYLPSSGGHTSSRLPFHQRVFAFHRYSVDEDGRLVTRMRNAGRDSHHKPYEHPLRSLTIQSGNQEVPPTSQDGSPRKQVDGAALSRLFQQLTPLTKDPSNFESNAAAICASFDLDPTTSTEIVSSFKQQLSADKTQGSNPPATSGPTTFQSRLGQPTNALNDTSNTTAPALTTDAMSTPTPFKQQ
ncbi:hypothetical protein BDM02DRAFT_3191011 [Thelephora ganbajun]|uniref:Uncharacterized protein n=1 Tax=Thelephora ganbajun TaxID=370292 RepID=A0ACB6Z4A2_THEGA|nr:hypothetical protein BDM02DRAFT_3191011 [Thelephora ganbajun]